MERSPPASPPASLTINRPEDNHDRTHTFHRRADRHNSGRSVFVGQCRLALLLWGAVRRRGASLPRATVKVYEPYEMPRIYIVDQGPVYSGPGIYTNPTVVLPHRMPRYPYIGRDYPANLPPYIEPLRSRAQY